MISLDTQPGSDEYLKGRSSPERYRIAVIEAEALGKKALGKDYLKYSQVLARKTSNIYRGQIVGQNDFFIVQKVSPLNTVRHLKQDLPNIPCVGENVRICYSAGICHIDQNLRQVRRRTHRIAL